MNDDIVANDKEQKRQLIARAQDAYLAALRNKDKEPEIYEGARLNYMRLTKGDGWLAQEKKRIETQKLDPEIDKYRQQYQTLKTEADVQKGYTESIATIRDKQSSMKGGLEGSMDFLGNLLDEKKTKLAAYNRYIELTKPADVHANQQIQSEAIPLVSYLAGFPASFLTVLDVILAVFILALLGLLYSKGSVLYAYFKNRFTRPGSMFGASA